MEHFRGKKNAVIDFLLKDKYISKMFLVFEILFLPTKHNFRARIISESCWRHLGFGNLCNVSAVGEQLAGEKASTYSKHEVNKIIIYSLVVPVIHFLGIQ